MCSEENKNARAFFEHNYSGQNIVRMIARSLDFEV